MKHATAIDLLRRFWLDDFDWLLRTRYRNLWF